MPVLQLAVRPSQVRRMTRTSFFCRSGKGCSAKAHRWWKALRQTRSKMTLGGAPRWFGKRTMSGQAITKGIRSEGKSAKLQRRWALMQGARRLLRQLTRQSQSVMTLPRRLAHLSHECWVVETTQAAQSVAPCWVHVVQACTKYSCISLRSVFFIGPCAQFFSSWGARLRHTGVCRVACLAEWQGAPHCFEVMDGRRGTPQGRLTPGDTSARHKDIPIFLGCKALLLASSSGQLPWSCGVALYKENGEA